MKKFFFTGVVAAIVFLVLFFFGIVKRPFFAKSQADVSDVVAMAQQHTEEVNPLHVDVEHVSLVRQVVHEAVDVDVKASVSQVPVAGTVSGIDQPVHLL